MQFAHLRSGKQCQRAAWPSHKAHCAEVGFFTAGLSGSRKATKEAYARFCEEHPALIMEGCRLAWEHRDKMPIIMLKDSTPPTLELFLSLEELASKCKETYNHLQWIIRTHSAHDPEMGYYLVFYPASCASAGYKTTTTVDWDGLDSEIKRLLREANERGEYWIGDEDWRTRLLQQAMQNVSVAQRRDATAAGSSSISRVAKEEVFVTTSLYEFPKDQMDIRVIESLVLDATGADATPEQIRATLQRAEAFYANHAPNPSMFHNFNAFRKGVTEGWMKFKIVLDNLASAPHLNGEEGTVLRKVTDSSGASRYVVQLQNGGREIAVRHRSFSTLSPFIDMI